MLPAHLPPPADPVIRRSADSVAAERLLDFLRDSGSYRGRPPRIRLVETHASYLAFAGRHVFKIKKAVNFGFLDFSTLEKRRHYCGREVFLNRRLCPEIYLGVVPITEKRGLLAFGGDGRVVEYAVKMRRLPERFFILRLLARGEVTPGHVDAIIAKLKPFYEGHEQTPEIAAWGRVAKLRISTAENFRQLQKFIGKMITRPALDAIRTYTNEFFRQHAPRFATRICEGRLRDCHGDLHLEHVHISPTRLTIYDCIEFNDRFRYIDVASETAFLAMDFDFHERRDLGRRFSTQMARALDDHGMLRLLDFYKCYRACVRGKVESLRHCTAGLVAGEQLKSRDRATRYLRLALEYAIRGSKPMVLVVMGRVGSGKSTLARSLGEQLDWKIISSDRLRKELAGVPLHLRGSEMLRRRLYAERMSNQTYSALARHAAKETHEGKSVILDATFGRRRRRQQLRKVLDRAGVDYCFVETRAAAMTTVRRLQKRARSAGEISDARHEDLPALDRAYEPPTEVAGEHFLAVKTTHAREAAVRSTLLALARRRAGRTSP